MTDEEFIANEELCLFALRDFVKQCLEFDIDPTDRLSDLIFRALENE
jgi:hypothetical protein